MKLSHEKSTHLSHVMVKALDGLPGVGFLQDRNPVRLKLLELLRAELRREIGRAHV